MGPVTIVHTTLPSFRRDVYLFGYAPQGEESCNVVVIVVLLALYTRISPLRHTLHLMEFHTSMESLIKGKTRGVGVIFLKKN